MTRSSNPSDKVDLSDPQFCLIKRGENSSDFYIG